MYKRGLNNKMEFTKYEMKIIKSWGIRHQEPLVSICCTTYNHELYIEKSIKGFLMQRTNFPFEILIHDDASTDKTQDIIRKYSKKYPNIIKPILQNENKYSKGIRVNLTYNYARAKGEFIALCEGDDYWTDNLKLQTQVDLMEKNKDLMLCVHATGVHKRFEDKIDKSVIKLSNGDRIISTSEIILGGGDYGHTSSFLFRKELIKDFPDWYIKYPSGDTPLRLLAAAKGKIYYIDKKMSIYRKGISGSWTDRMKDNNKFIDHWKKGITLYQEYDKYTNYKYSKLINKRISTIAYSILLRINNSSENEMNIIEYRKLLLWNDRIKYLLRIKFPHLVKIIKIIRSKEDQKN